MRSEKYRKKSKKHCEILVDIEVLLHLTAMRCTGRAMRCIGRDEMYRGGASGAARSQAEPWERGQEEAESWERASDQAEMWTPAIPIVRRCPRSARRPLWRFA